MKGIIFYLLCIFVAVIVIGCTPKTETVIPVVDTPPQQNGQPHEIPSSPVIIITINQFAFTPKYVIVKAGTLVTWTNLDTVPHSIKSDSFSSGTLQINQSFDHKFESKGTFNYSCGIHPSMTGTIIVE